MSIFYPYSLSCPGCAHAYEINLVEGLHISRMPALRQQILESRFHQFVCPMCNQQTHVECPLIYTDFERGHYVAIEQGRPTDWQRVRDRHVQVFHESFAQGPPVAQHLGAALQTRLVFGFASLREKLLLWDAGLDDLVVEAIKGDVLAALELAPGTEALRLSCVLEGGHLLLSRSAVRPRRDHDGAIEVLGRPEIFGFETVTHDEYVERRQDRSRIFADYPWLTENWFVDIESRGEDPGT